MKREPTVPGKPGALASAFSRMVPLPLVVLDDEATPRVATDPAWLAKCIAHYRDRIPFRVRSKPTLPSRFLATCVMLAIVNWLLLSQLPGPGPVYFALAIFIAALLTTLRGRWISARLATSLATDKSVRPLDQDLAIRARIQAGYCPACNYKLMQLSPDDDEFTTCPECGARWHLAAHKRERQPTRWQNNTTNRKSAYWTLDARGRRVRLELGISAQAAAWLSERGARLAIEEDLADNRCPACRERNTLEVSPTDRRLVCSDCRAAWNPPPPNNP